jgi:hypothetical protein
MNTSGTALFRTAWRQAQVLEEAPGRLSDVVAHGITRVDAVAAGEESRHPPVPCGEAEVSEVRDAARAVGDDPNPMSAVAEVLGDHALADGVSHAYAVDTDDHVERSYVSGHDDPFGQESRVMTLRVTAAT